MGGLSSAESAPPETIEMGHGLPVPQGEGGSHYRMRDETKSIMRLSIRLNETLPGAQQGDFSVNATVDMAAFAPEEFRHPELFLPRPTGLESSVVNEDVGHETMADEPNAHSMENTPIGASPAVAQIKGTGLHTRNGEPMCLVNAVPPFKVLKDGAPAAGDHDPRARRVTAVRRP